MKLIANIGLAVILFCSSPASAQVKPGSASLKISGEVTKDFAFTKDDLRKLDRTTAILKDRDGRDVPYTGVSVQRLLEMAGVTTGKQLRGENLTKYLLVKCADGYEILFSLAELDNGFNDKKVILANESAGKDLPVDRGPFRIVIEGEKVPARSSFQVVEFKIAFAK
ncbi:MAG: molybdopterin-dependent oxidoreductase [Flavitalea sp.]